jgi:hypothetical protein
VVNYQAIHRQAGLPVGSTGNNTGTGISLAPASFWNLNFSSFQHFYASGGISSGAIIFLVPAFSWRQHSSDISAL